MTWLDDRRGDFAPIFATDSSGDLPGDSSFWPRCSCSLATTLFCLRINGDQPRRSTDAGSSGHRDTNAACGLLRRTRLVYTEPAFLTGAHPLEGRRTIHLGIDVFAPAGSQIAPPLEATVVATATGGKGSV